MTWRTPFLFSRKSNVEGVPRLATLNQGVQSQSSSVQRINESMVRLSTVAREIADALHETDQSISLLSDETQALREEVAHFKLNLE